MNERRTISPTGGYFLVAGIIMGVLQLQQSHYYDFQKQCQHPYYCHVYLPSRLFPPQFLMKNDHLGNHR